MPKKQKIVMSKNEQEQHKTRSVSEYSSPFCWQQGIAVQPHRGHFGGSYKAWRMLLLLLSHISRVRLCATPQTAAHQAPPSLGFSREGHWSGVPFPSMRESEVAQSCPTLSDPMDRSLPGFSVHGSFQAKVLEWVAIAFTWRIHLPFISEEVTLKSQTRI